MKKGRYWATVGYPESLPSNWLELLTDIGLPCAISPLHDKDINPDEHEKKAHYHIIFAFDGPTTFNNVKSICTELNMVNPIKLESIKGMYRYHIHLDNPEKYQYNDTDRIILNGFDTQMVNELSKTEVQKIKQELIGIIRLYNIFEYSSLLDYLLDENLQQLFDVASNNTIFFNTYITSFRHKILVDNSL